MYIQRICLRKLVTHSTVRRHSHPSVLLIPAIIARQHTLVLHICQHHIPESLAHTRLIITKQAIPHYIAHILIHMRPIHQVRHSCLRIVTTSQSIHKCAVRRNNIRFRHNLRHFRIRVIIQLVRFQVKFRIHQHHSVLEYRLADARCILPVIRIQHVILIIQRTMSRIEAHTFQPVIIYDIRHQLSFPMNQHRTSLCMCLHHRTIILQGVARQCQRVALHHFHMSIRFKGMIILIETGTVAIQIHAVMIQLHMSNQHIRTYILTIFVEHITMYQLHFLT